MCSAHYGYFCRLRPHPYSAVMALALYISKSGMQGGAWVRVGPWETAVTCGLSNLSVVLVAVGVLGWWLAQAPSWVGTWILENTFLGGR